MPLTVRRWLERELKSSTFLVQSAFGVKQIGPLLPLISITLTLLTFQLCTLAPSLLHPRRQPDDNGQVNRRCPRLGMLRQKGGVGMYAINGSESAWKFSLSPALNDLIFPRAPIDRS